MVVEVEAPGQQGTFVDLDCDDRGAELSAREQHRQRFDPRDGLEEQHAALDLGKADWTIPGHRGAHCVADGAFLQPGGLPELELDALDGAFQHRDLNDAVADILRRDVGAREEIPALAVVARDCFRSVLEVGEGQVPALEAHEQQKQVRLREYRRAGDPKPGHREYAGRWRCKCRPAPLLDQRGVARGGH